MALQPITPVLPYPDFHTCDGIYGDIVNTADCLALVGDLPGREEIIAYTTNPGRSHNGPFNIPMKTIRGDCVLQIEVGGNAAHPRVWASPGHLRDLAYFVYNQCVLGAKIGGFATHHFSNLLDWSLSPITVLQNPIPAGASFVTVSLTSRSGSDKDPANNDPEIPIALAAGNLIASRLLPLGSEAARKTKAISDYWTIMSSSMIRGGYRPWWRGNSPAPQDEMTYECDDLLGNPPVADCSQIEWNQIGPAPDTIVVGTVVTFLHSSSCYLAISATVNLVLAWEQIRAALAALMNVCVQHPYQPPQGGRAYFGAQPKHVSGHKSRRRSGLTGLNALPPHVNITIFQQSEAWTNPADELRSCTWKAVLGGRAVKSCNPR